MSDPAPGSLTTPAPSPVMQCPQCGQRSADGLRFCPSDGAKLVMASEQSASVGGTTRRAPPSLVGKVIADRYRLLRKIGEGGMGEVYEAQHVYIDKRVAIKTLRREILDNPEATARFQQEAHAASTIGHENIVTIDDFGQLPDGGVYMAMEFLEGSSLAERARAASPLGRGEILDVAVQLCRGLGAAHDKGIIHRDIKPENVFLAKRSGRLVVKILDFGIAKVQHGGGGGAAGSASSASSAHLTQTGAVFGTPFYMSPEQALGKPLDARTDVYSVGVILYELFAGRVPFEGDSFMAILSQHITTQPLPPSRVAPKDRPVPPAFERLILKAMAKEREQRFPSMKALGEALLEAERRSAAETLEGLGPEGGAPSDPVELAELPRNRMATGEQDAATGMELAVPAGAGKAKLVLWAALGAALVLGVTGATVLALRGRWKDAPATPLSASAANPADPPRLTPSPRPMPGTTAGNPPGGDAAHSWVVLDSIPSGAKVFAGGQLLCETPDAIKIPKGRTLEVLLHKEGFVSRQVTIDPARDGRKVMVRLERDARHQPPGAPTVLLPAPSPTLPSVVPPPPPPPSASPRPATKPIAPPPPVELYAPLPPPPRRTPTRAPSAPAPLDPYAN